MGLQEIALALIIAIFCEMRLAIHKALKSIDKIKKVQAEHEKKDDDRFGSVIFDEAG